MQNLDRFIKPDSSTFKIFIIHCQHAEIEINFLIVWLVLQEDF